MTPIYKPHHIAYVIPTRNRGHKIRNLLESMLRQPHCGRIVIVDSGESIAHIVNEYAQALPVEYYPCSFSGQIAQRNFGISLLNESTPLVACLDDDIVLEDGCITNVCEFWNGVESNTAGVGFNITNQPPTPADWLRRITLQTTPKAGKVLSSGTSSNYHGTDIDLRTEWLCGGATIWRLKVLREHPQIPIKVRWAIGEDLAFSYPIGLKHPLYVCSKAKVRHEHVYDYSVKRSAYYHGLIQTLMRFNFILANNELSKSLFAYSILSTALGKLLVGLILLKPRFFLFSFGQLHALMGGTWAHLQGRNFVDYIAFHDSRFSR